jgi:hypothetical protein
VVELFSELEARFTSFCEYYYGTIQEGGAPKAPLIPQVQGRDSVSEKRYLVRARLLRLLSELIPHTDKDARYTRVPDCPVHKINLP